jgi:hypothetical protein
MKRALTAWLVPCAILCAHDVHAQPSDEPTRDASKHFRRGVELYTETNYPGALIEFKRALELAPNASTLYNVGETQFQLQDYAAALATFRRYLDEAPPTDGHRAEVERNVRVLNARVGYVHISTVPAGAEVSVDDEFVGRTPLARPVLFSIGHRKVVASLPGRPPVTRYIDVATDDDLSITVQLPPPAVGTALPESDARWSSSLPSARPGGSAAGWRTVAWVGAGTLGAAAITFGGLAIEESRELQRARSAYPASASTLSHASNLTATYSVAADCLAAATIVVGGLALYWTLSTPSSTSSRRGSAPATRILLGPSSAHFQALF